MKRKHRRCLVILLFCVDKLLFFCGCFCSKRVSIFYGAFTAVCKQAFVFPAAHDGRRNEAVERTRRPRTGPETVVIAGGARFRVALFWLFALSTRNTCHLNGRAASAGLHDRVGEIDEQLGKAPFGGRVVTKDGGERRVSEGFGKALPQRLASACVVRKPAKSVLPLTWHTFPVVSRQIHTARSSARHASRAGRSAARPAEQPCC